MQKKIKINQDPFFEREAQKYVNPIPSREFIMQYLLELGRPASKNHLIEAFELQNEESKEAFRRRLQAMLRDGQIITNRRGSFALVKQMSLICGRVVGHKEGFGFLVPEDGSKDIFLNAREMRLVFPGDRVLVSITSADSRGRPEGAIVEILERAITQITGRYFEEDNVAFVVPANKDISKEVIIPSGKHLDAESGQLVTANIINYPTKRLPAVGEIIEVLGEHMAPGMEIEVAIRSHELPFKWSNEALKDLKDIPKEISKKEQKKRQDLRKLPFVTIDGEDAKDFDDAVFCEHEKKGWILYVAIADVSFYVRSSSTLDQEALARGNSVYFPGYVVPMLPEILSNELCSLKPNVDRLTMVCKMHINASGVVTNYNFYEAIIHSHARLTYDQVFAMLEEKNHKNNSNSKKLKEILPHLKTLREVYLALEKHRKNRGALEFETPETRIIFGQNRKIKNIVEVSRNYAHKIIEECMLAANVCTSKFLLKHLIPALYRVNEVPSEEKLDNLRRYLGGLGLTLFGGKKPKPSDYAKLISQVEKRKDALIVQTMLLRSLQQAIYTPENLGHFALAYSSYAHFTSPIRRFPDLINHRAIRHILQEKNLNSFVYDENSMRNFGEHCSMTERRADEATRDAIDWLKCEYMRNKVGKTFDGIISNVTNFGVFVSLKDVFVEGLLHVTALHNDYYQYDPIKLKLRGKRSGKSYALGDPIRVRIARVDLDERQIDFELHKNK